VDDPLRDALVVEVEELLAQDPFGKLALLAVISLFLFHGCHRILHSLHDLGLGTGLYGLATGATILAAALLLAIGFR